MDSIKTGALIAEARKQKNMTQSELAELLHVSDRTVSKWERGAGFPDVSLLEPLADALDLTVVALLHGEAAPVGAAEELSVREAVRILAAESRRALRRMVKVCAAVILLMLIILKGFEFLATNGDGFDHGVNARSTRTGIENTCRSISSRGVYRIEISAAERAVPDRYTVLTEEEEITQFLAVFSKIELGRTFRDWGPDSLTRRIMIYTSGYTPNGEFIDTEDSRFVLTFPAFGMTTGALTPGRDSEAEFYYHAEIDNTDAWEVLEDTLVSLGYP